MNFGYSALLLSNFGLKCRFSHTLSHTHFNFESGKLLHSLIRSCGLHQVELSFPCRAGACLRPNSCSMPFSGETKWYDAKSFLFSNHHVGIPNSYIFHSTKFLSTSRWAYILKKKLFSHLFKRPRMRFLQLPYLALVRPLPVGKLSPERIHYMYRPSRNSFCLMDRTPKCLTRRGS